MFSEITLSRVPWAFMPAAEMRIVFNRSSIGPTYWRRPSAMRIMFRCFLYSSAVNL